MKDQVDASGLAAVAQHSGLPCRCIVAAWLAHRRELRAHLRHQLADAALADDLLQDVFVKALLQGDAFCDVGNPRAWLYQVARHAVVDRQRRERPGVSVEVLAELPAEVGHPEPIDELQACVARTLPELPAADADILRACDLQGMTQVDYAARHGLSLPAAKARLLRARRRLRDRITQACRVQFDAESGRVCGHRGRPGPAPDEGIAPLPGPA